MAFPAGWAKKAQLTWSHPTAVNSFPVHISADIIRAHNPNMIRLGHVDAARSDGGDIRVTSDSAGTNVLPCEIACFSLDPDPANSAVSIWFKANLTLGVTFYLWWGKADAAQPNALDPTGTIAVWDCADSVWHFEEAISDADIGSAAVFYDSKKNAVNLALLSNTQTGIARVDAVAARGARGRFNPLVNTQGAPINAQTVDNYQFPIGSTLSISCLLNLSSFIDLGYAVLVPSPEMTLAKLGNNFSLLINPLQSVTPPYGFVGSVLSFYFAATSGKSPLWLQTRNRLPDNWPENPGGIIPVGNVHFGFVFTFGNGASLRFFINGVEMTLGGWDYFDSYRPPGLEDEAPQVSAANRLILGSAGGTCNVFDEFRIGKDLAPTSWDDWFKVEAETYMTPTAYLAMAAAGDPVIGNGSLNAPTVPAPTLNGRGYASTSRSRLFPGTTGKISHARILSAYRDADRALAFHNSMKGT
jgi:hypothetical protein